MESKKIQWNKLLNYLIASISLILACIFIGFCFIIPTNSIKANALTKSDIVDTYNIYFNSAKTRIKTANGYNKISLLGQYNERFESYNYNYNDIQNTKLFYSSEGSNSLSSYSGYGGDNNNMIYYGDVQLSTTTKEVDAEGNPQTTIANQTIYEEFGSIKSPEGTDVIKLGEFIPHGVSHFDNNGTYEKIFYEEIDNGDFVLLDNYTNHITTDSFNVETLYLSFGTPYVDEIDHTTPVHDLKVSATLINTDNESHFISLNQPYQTSLKSFTKNNVDLLSLYWYQYFDLRDVYGTDSEGKNIYAIENTQGKYEFTFEFIRYTRDDEGYITTEGIGTKIEQFTYTFYLLDAAKYDTIPSVHNSTLGSVEYGQSNEYFYNFNTDSPYVTYNPNNFNLSYKRENREIIENITSSYSVGNYKLDSNSLYYPKSVITYNKTTNEDNTKVEEKQVFILTYYNQDRTFVEYLYLADINNSFNDSNTQTLTYDNFEKAILQDKLKFEYKIAKVLTITGDNPKKYQTTTYKTTNYYDHNLNTAENISIYEDSNYHYEKISTDYILESITVNGGENIHTYKYSNDGQVENETIIANITSTNSLTIYNNGETNVDPNWTALNSTNGLYISIDNLLIQEGTNAEVSQEVFNYKLVTENNETKIVKTYKDYSTTDTEKTSDVIINTNTPGIYEVIDTVHKLSIKYQILAGSTIKQIEILKNEYQTENLKANTKILNRINQLETVPMELNYELTFDDLGIYTLNYDYCITAGERDSTTSVVNRKTFNNSSTSTNRLNLKDYSLAFEEHDVTSEVITSALNIKVWGYLDANNKIILNGKEYTYDKAGSKLQDKWMGVDYPLKNNLFEQNKFDKTVIDPSTGNSENQYINVSKDPNFGSFFVPATYEISSGTNGGYILTITYTIGTIETTKISTENLATLYGKNYVNNYDIVTQQKYILNADIKGQKICSADLTKELVIADVDKVLSNIENLLKFLESPNNSIQTELAPTDPEYNPEYNDTTTVYNKDYFTDSVNHNSDILHIYGSITYFNKKDNSTDSKYAKMEQVDSKLKKNYISDVTSLYLKNANTSNKIDDISTFNISNLKGFASDVIGKNANQIDPENLIITDMTPVFWKNFSTLLYNGKISQSYIYRYPNYKIDKETGNIEYGECVSSIYTKDTYVQFDGLYEIIVLYKYDYYKEFDNVDANNNTVFYQLFTFAIDNSSPSLNIKVKDDFGNYEQSLGLNKYTNKDIELSWKIPTYFQNNIYLDINKQTYTNDNDNFKAEYTNGVIITKSGISNVTSYEVDEENKLYRVYITSDNATATITPNGKYKVTLHYSSRGESTVTDEFIIDKLPIDGTSVQPVIQNANGTYSINTYSEGYNSSKQIVNYDFTYRYNPKASGAKIFTYWYKIDLVNASADEYDKIKILDDANNAGKTAITTTFKVNGKNLDDISLGNQYIYDYNTSTTVNNANYFSSTNSCIYLFKMSDEAGNECRYVVFYDTTNPRFIMEPEAGNDNNIINDSTRITFGNYKAILIDTADGYEIDLSQDLDNYNFKYDKTIINDNLKESLIYINSKFKSTTAEIKDDFNETQVVLHDDQYYLLLPIDSVTVTDDSSTTLRNGQNYITYSQSEGTTVPTEYYFFPKNPLNENKTQIELPIITKDSDDKIISYEKSLFDINSFETKKLVNTDLKQFDRFIQTTDKDVYGAFGEGEFTYQVFDRQRNKTSGYVWMNLDKTQTILYGLYNKNIEDASKAFSLGDASGGISSAASSLYVSSLIETETATEDNLPDYTVTYLYYKFNPDYFSEINDKYAIHSVEILDKNSKNTEFTIEDDQVYLQFNYKDKNDTKENPTIQKTIYIEKINKYGDNTPKHSYPYELEGSALVTNSNSEAEHIYQNNKSTYYEDSSDGQTRRIFSTIINPTADASGNGNIVTQEGLYIFKREYATNTTQEQLGEDSMIRYQVVYIDRSGIINIAISDAIVEQFGFILGRDYTGEDNEKLKEFITAEQIQNEQVLDTSNASASSTHTSANNLFTTNKTQVQFNLTADKYNFKSFYNDFYNELSTKFPTLSEYWNTQMFNEVFYSQNLYKVNLTLNKTGVSIIDESNMDITKQFNITAINDLLKEHAKVNISADSYNDEGTYLGKETYSFRSNTYNFFLEDSASNPYSIYLKDNSGYRLLNGNEVLDNNYLANQLDTSFTIKHTAPTGDAYGKDYSIDYDEDKSSPHSIPIDTNGNYMLLQKYLAERKLEVLSLDYKNVENTTTGQKVTLYSTNNETLILSFSITQDKYQAQIDPNNIVLYKDGQVIFERVDGNFSENASVSSERMLSSFIANTIDGITHYAIIVFDNNLDDILNDSEKAEGYNQFRLLDPKDNPDKAKYSITLNYVGSKENYIKEDANSNQLSYASTTYDIIIDRIKPMYNVTKLMSLDKFVYNPIKSSVNSDNYETVFETYKTYYKFDTNEEYDFERSYLENYFFALDYREKTQFVFESISEFDSNNGIYIRHVDKNNYKFSVTPDDYRAYNTSSYLEGHPLFSSSRATSINSFMVDTNSEREEIKSLINSDTSTYYYLPFAVFGQETNSKAIKASDLSTILRVNECYEIIECDEAGNYRVYAVYIPDFTSTKISYEYRANQASLTQTASINYTSNTRVTVGGIEFELTEFLTEDRFVKAYVEISSLKLNEKLSVYYEPNDMCIYVKDSKNVNLDTISNVSKDEYRNIFIETINKLIEEYNDKITTESSTYYSKYGHTIKLTFVDRIGVETNISNRILYDYEITYNVAGSILTPIFKNGANSFTITIPGKTGTTNIVDITAYIFKGGWSVKDPDDKLNSFNKSAEELMNGFTYTLGKGVYKFVLIDNFGRENTYFYEYGSPGTQAGGNLKFSNTNVAYSDGYTYTGKSASFIYDNTLYDVYVRYIGSTIDEDIMYDENDIPHIVYRSNGTFTDADLRPYGITISTTNNITTITFLGVSHLSKYHIKALPAGISAQYDYTWGKEDSVNDILVYNKKVAIYKAIASPIIKNLNGNILDTSEHLHLTEDFEVTISWLGVDFDTQIDFNSKIVLTRTYTENNRVKTQTLNNASTYLISQPGEYTAYVINSLNTISNAITFTRGEGQISMYAVYTRNKESNTDTQLIPSYKVDNEEYSTETESRNIIVFNYFTTIDYFSFKDEYDNKITTYELSSDTPITNFKIDETSNHYLDIRVNSNLSIFVDLYKLTKDGDTPLAEFRIYSKSSSEEEYTYRLIKVYFLDNTNYNLATTTINTTLDADNIYKGNNPIIKRPDNSLIVKFMFIDAKNNSIKYIDGNTIFVDRYYNNEFVETISFTNISESTQAVFELKQVGLHKFVIRDLADRKQIFGSADSSNETQSLQIYLINQILFTVNDESPINNQIFNGTVNLKVLSTLNDFKLYNTETLGITVTRNGTDLGTPNSTDLTFTEQGYYTVKIVATTVLSDETTNISDQEIISVYNFVILRTDVALRNFNVSKGTGFVIDKLIKIVNNEKTDITHSYENQDSLLWLSHDTQGNSIFEVTLKYYDTNLKVYRPFTFNVWINEDSPVIISSIPNGTSTKDVITLDFNPGMIYTQIGRCKILVNNSLYMQIDENSQRVSNTISITKKGTYFVQIVSEDGSIISSYKFTKSDPINKTTQTVLICVGIGIVVLVAIFFLVRRKGKYR